MIDVKDFDTKEVQEAIKKIVYKSLKEMLNEIKPGDQLGVLVYQLLNEFKEFRYETNERLDHIEKNMATKDDIKNMATKDDLKNMATKDDIKNMATKNDLKNMATKDDLNDMAKKIVTSIGKIISEEK